MTFFNINSNNETALLLTDITSKNVEMSNLVTRVSILESNNTRLLILLGLLLVGLGVYWYFSPPLAVQVLTIKAGLLEIAKQQSELLDLLRSNLSCSRSILKVLRNTDIRVMSKEDLFIMYTKLSDIRFNLNETTHELNSTIVEQALLLEEVDAMLNSIEALLT